MSSTEGRRLAGAAWEFLLKQTPPTSPPEAEFARRKLLGGGGGREVVLLLRGGGAGAVSLPDDQVSPSWSGSWAGVLLEEVSPGRAGPKIPCNTGQLSLSDLTLEMSDNFLPVAADVDPSDHSPLLLDIEQVPPDLASRKDNRLFSPLSVCLSATWVKKLSAGAVSLILTRQEVTAGLRDQVPSASLSSLNISSFTE